jgi:hypothetical protein
MSGKMADKRSGNGGEQPERLSEPLKSKTLYRDIPRDYLPTFGLASTGTTFRRISMCQERLCGRIMCDMFIGIKLICLFAHEQRLPYAFAMCQAPIILYPASTKSVSPVIARARGLHRNNAASPTSL